MSLLRRGLIQFAKETVVRHRHTMVKDGGPQLQTEDGKQAIDLIFSFSVYSSVCALQTSNKNCGETGKNKPKLFHTKAVSVQVKCS